MKNNSLEIRDVFLALGTEIEIDIIVDDKKQEKKAQLDLEKVKSEYVRWEAMLSRFSPDSELSHLNSNLHFSQEASHDILELSRRCLEYYKKTKGIFDPRIIEDLENIGYRNDFKKGIMKKVLPNLAEEKYQRSLAEDILINGERITFHSRVDLGGIAKGYVTDKIAGFLRDESWQDFFVNSGGDIYFAGKDKKKPWYFSVEGIEEGQLLLEAIDCGVATSGISRRKWEIDGKKFHHLVNPRKPDDFSFDLKTVTVVAKTTQEADVWAKVLFLMGKDEGKKYATEKKLKCIFLDYRGNAWISPGIKKHIHNLAK